MKIKTFDVFVSESADNGLSIKDDYEYWLNRFKRNINGFRFTAVKSYIRALSYAEDIAGMERDAIYKTTSAKKLAAILDKVKASQHPRKNFIERVLLVYRNRLEIRHFLKK
jgi:hypothetical protein